MPKVVLLTGVSQFEGVRLAAQLAADPTVDRIIGVDARAPSPLDAARLGRTEFVQADIRSPIIARIIGQADVDTVVHNPGSPVGGTVGAMQLLAACQKSDAMRRLVVRSSTAVYGCSPCDAAVFTEQMSAREHPRDSHAKSAIEIESHVRGFGRRRPDVVTTVLRIANLIAPSTDTPLSRYFGQPVVATELGYDQRIQFVHEIDAIEVLRQAATEDHPGVFNVAGRGVLTLTQAIRRAGRLPLPLPGRLFAAMTRSGSAKTSPPVCNCVDVTKLVEEFPYEPEYTTAQAFAALLDAQRLHPVITDERLEQAERLVRSVIGGRLG
jgi:UDP-glucose 4-epimerase